MLGAFAWRFDEARKSTRRNDRDGCGLNRDGGYLVQTHLPGPGRDYRYAICTTVGYLVSLTITSTPDIAPKEDRAIVQ